MNHLLGGWIGCCTLLAMGCSSGTSTVATQPMDPTQERLLKIGQAYWQYSGAHRMPPKSAADIKPILRQEGNEAEVFRSTRDGEPFVICWATEMVTIPSGPGSRPILAYEKTGKDGTRFVLLTLRNVELLTEDQFRESSFPWGYEPKP